MALSPTGQFDEYGNAIYAMQNLDGSIDYYADDGELQAEDAPSGPIVDFGYGYGGDVLGAGMSAPVAPPASTPAPETQSPPAMPPSATGPMPSPGGYPGTGQGGPDPAQMQSSSVVSPSGQPLGALSPESGSASGRIQSQLPLGHMQAPFAGMDQGGLPPYQDGSMHPAFGGPLRMPGYGMGQGSDGSYAPANTVYRRNYPKERTYHENAGTLSSGGSYPGMPGPGYGARSTRGGGSGGSLRGGFSDSFGGSGGGGGGGGSALYQAWRSKLTSKMYPGSGSGYSGSSSSYGSGGSTYGYDDPKKPKLTGYARGMDPDNAAALYDRPTMMLPRVAKGIDTTTPYYEMLSSLPAYEMALLGGSRKKATDTNSLNTYVNSLGRTYDNAAATGNLPDYQTMKNQFTNAKPESSLGQMFRPTPDENSYIAGYTKQGKPQRKKIDPVYDFPPLATAAETAQRMVGAIGTAGGLDPRVTHAMETRAGQVADEVGSRALTQDPRKMIRMNRIIGRKVLI